MRDADRHDLIGQLVLETTSAGRSPTSVVARDLSVLVTAALLAASASAEDLLADALRLATATPDRQVVTIAAAYLAGEHERVEALAADHLLDHPARPVLAWILTHNRSAPPEQPTQEPIR